MACAALAAHSDLGLWAATATMNGKERAIEPHPLPRFEIVISTALGIDMNALGTFIFEITPKYQWAANSRTHPRPRLRQRNKNDFSRAT